MPCFRPITAWRGSGGTIVFNGRKALSRHHAFELPCGKCQACRSRRAREWAVRCVHEAQMHERNCFLTLTYDEDHLPEDGSLHVEHWQKFAKKVRKRFGSFRYLHCGEYGEKNGRPHYHACVFGLDWRKGRHVTRSEPYELWTHPELEQTWSKGFALVGSLTMGSASYVAQYCLKKAASEKYGMRRPPYVTMSRRPGLGTSWLEKYARDVFPRDEVIIEGKRFTPPRFYVEKRSEAEVEKIRKDRIAAAQRGAGDLTPVRLRDREIVAEARLSLRGRQ